MPDNLQGSAIRAKWLTITSDDGEIYRAIVIVKDSDL